MDDYPHLDDQERSILELLDAAAVGSTRREIDQAHQLLDLGDRVIAQQAALAEIKTPTPDPTSGEGPP
jgi:hypothetical protein